MKSPEVPRVVAALSFAAGILAYGLVFFGWPDKPRESVRPQIPQPSLVDAK